jgi:hypothetical protein
MMQNEFTRAVALHRQQTCSRLNYCSVCEAIRRAPVTAFDVACRFYASDRLDQVPGINGQSRHDVFIAWIHRRPQPFLDAITHVEAAEMLAAHAALADVEKFIQPPRP